MKEGMNEQGLLRIGEIADETGLPISKIRYYTEIGLLKIVTYTEGGQFLYSKEESLNKIALIKELTKRGLSLKEIKDHLDEKRELKRVIVIDDDEDFARLVKDMLEKSYPKWEIKISTNVFEAGILLVDFLPDLAILDVRLPGVKGFEICKFIRENPLLKNMKILSVSSCDSRDTRETMFSFGADAFMPKPINIDIFLGKIAEIMALDKAS